MDDQSVREASGRDQASLDKSRARKGRKPAGLQVINRGGFWHIHGRVRIGGRSIRVRKATGLPARPELWEDADAIRVEVEREIRNDVIHGVKPSIPVAVAADRYLSRPRERALGATTQTTIREVGLRFKLRLLRDIEPHEWNDWVAIRHATNAPATRERYINDLLAFLSWASKRPNEWLPTTRLPVFERDKAARNPNRRARRRVTELTPDLVALMIENAAPHYAPQLATMWSTGARVSSILYGTRLCDLILAPGREQITFHDTKNGEAVVAALHPFAAEKLAQYLEWRGNLHRREDPLFLTHRRQPYKDNGRAWGGQNKTAFNAMKRRTAGAIRRAGAAEAKRLWRAGEKKGARDVAAEVRETATLVGRVTQHWFRHLLATKMLQLGDMRSTMAQGGWLDPRSVMGYAHDVPEHRRGIVGRLSEQHQGRTSAEVINGAL